MILPKKILYSVETRCSLQSIAKAIFSESYRSTISGIAGIGGNALFLYNYAQLTGDNSFGKFADRLINKVSESIDEDSAVDYLNGLAGFGTAIIYLMRNNLLEIDEDYLSDLDEVIYYVQQKNNLPFLSSLTGISGVAQYYIERAKDGLKENCQTNEFNEKIISYFSEALACAYNSYSQIICAMDLICRLKVLKNGNNFLKTYFDYALDKLETMQHEDNFFQVAYDKPDRVRYAIVLLNAYAAFGEDRYKHLALSFLETDVVYVEYLQGNTFILEWLPIQNKILYYLLSWKLNNELMRHDLASALLKTDIRTFRDSNEKVPYKSSGLHYGYAAYGMSLFSLCGICSNDWMDLVPVAY